MTQWVGGWSSNVKNWPGVVDFSNWDPPDIVAVFLFCSVSCFWVWPSLLGSGYLVIVLHYCVNLLKEKKTNRNK